MEVKRGEEGLEIVQLEAKDKDTESIAAEDNLAPKEDNPNKGPEQDEFHKMPTIDGISSIEDLS